MSRFTKTEKEAAERLHHATCNDLSCGWDYETWERAAEAEKIYYTERGRHVSVIRKFKNSGIELDVVLTVLKIWGK